MNALGRFWMNDDGVYTVMGLAGFHELTYSESRILELASRIPKAPSARTSS